MGPVSEDQAIPCEKNALLRDWLYTLSVLQEKYGKPMTTEIDGMSVASGDVLASLIENALPPSFQRDQSSMLWFLMQTRGLRKRQLQERLDDLQRQYTDLPDTIEEKLAARERAEGIMGMLGGVIDQALDELKMGQNLTDRSSADTTIRGGQ